jgi:hypothetical protein
MQYTCTSLWKRYSHTFGLFVAFLETHFLWIRTGIVFAPVDAIVLAPVLGGGSLVGGQEDVGISSDLLFEAAVASSSTRGVMGQEEEQEGSQTQGHA